MNNDNDDTTGRRPTQERPWHKPKPVAVEVESKTLVAAALDLAERRDWYVFAAPASGEKKGEKAGKYSNGRRWGNTKNPDEIRHDFKKWPGANLGVPTGVDNRIFVLEVDTREGHGVDGIATFKQLQAEHGVLPLTLNAESPTASLHHYFNYPRDLSGRGKITSRALDPQRYPGIDVKGDGGMVIAPPSVRPGVGTYKWINDNEIVDAPQWLLDMVVERVGEPPPDYDGGSSAEKWTSLIENICRGHALHDSTRDLAAMMVVGELNGGVVVNLLRGLMDQSRAKQNTPERWRERYDDIPNLVSSAAKLQRAAPAIIRATPVIWRDPSQIPQREWLYYPYYIRGSVTGTAASGGTGKSTLGISESISMATGQPLLGTEPASELRVWYWNGEETDAELERKLAAVKILHGLTAEDFGGRLFVNSGLLMPIVIAETLRGDTKICQPVVDQVISTLKENQIDVLILDPFVSTRRVSEQDNDDIDMVVKKWMAIAVAANCAIHIFGHTRKNLNEYVTADDARGASAFKDALRCLRVLNPMSGREAEKADIDESERSFYFRADNGKKNLTPVGSAHWYRLQSVNLGNGLVRIPGVPTVGDAVGVATPWEYPSLGDDIGPEQIKLGLEAVRSGGPWRFDQRSTVQPWVGVPIAKALAFDLEKRVDKDTVINLIKKWITAGWLAKVPGQDPHGRGRDYVEVVRVVGERVTSPDRQSTP